MTFRTLCIYVNGALKILDNYEICRNTANIRHKHKKNILTQIDNDGYKRVVVRVDGKNQSVSVARAMLSTFVGPPIDPTFTADHINQKRDDDRLDNLRWASKWEQISNRSTSLTNNGGRIVIYGSVEKTVKDWADTLGLCVSTIKWRVENKLDWSYKTYDNIPGEVWVTIENNTEVSSLGRVGKINTSVRRVYETREICRSNGYPVLNINKQKRYLHILVFKAFYPDEYETKQDGHMICHKNDDKLDCRIDNLYLGSASNNTTDAHNNGKFDGTNRERSSCCGTDIITGEKRQFDSLPDAVIWLKNNGYPKAAKSSISRCLNNKLNKTYGHTWYK
jgi:hypothetical protein